MTSGVYHRDGRRQGRQDSRVGTGCRYAVYLVALLSLTGCTVTKVRYGEVKVTRSHLFTKQVIQDMDVQIADGQGGTKRLVVSGYHHDQGSSEAMIEAVARGVVSGMKP
jgi:hypothetical protein